MTLVLDSSRAPRRWRYWDSVAPRLVDPRAGVVHDLTDEGNLPGAPPFFHYTSRLGNLAALGWVGNRAEFPGASWSRERAARNSMAEALRFYAASFYNPTELPVWTARDAPSRCVEPGEFTNLSSAVSAAPGGALAPFDDTTPVAWVRGVDLVSRATLFVPAFACLFPYAARTDVGEVAVRPDTSGGLACSCGHDEAILAALVDAIREEALMAAWTGGEAPAHVWVETLSDRNYETVRRFERDAGDVTLLHLGSAAGVPVVVACLEARVPGLPAVTMGSGAHVEAEQAVSEALEELALALRVATLAMSRRPAPDDAPAFGTGRTPGDHLRYWCEREHRSRLDFFLDTRARVEFQELPQPTLSSSNEAARHLVDALSALGTRVYHVDLTPPDLRDLGLHVARAVVPALRPLCAGWTDCAAPPHPFLVRTWRHDFENLARALFA